MSIVPLMAGQPPVVVGGPSRPLSLERAPAPAPRGLCYKKPMSTALAVALGPTVPPEINRPSPPSAHGLGRVTAGTAGVAGPRHVPQAKELGAMIFTSRGGVLAG